MSITVNTINPSEIEYLYSKSSAEDVLNGCIGHLRGDFDTNGKMFYSTWSDHQKALKTNDFKADLDFVINELRQDDGLLKNREAMYNYCHKNSNGKFESSNGNNYGYRIDTEHFTYMIRCYPPLGDYNFYVYVYQKDKLATSLKHIEPVNKNKLPERCFSILPSSGDCIIISRNEEGYRPFFYEKDRTKNRAYVDDYNKRHGVTKAQEEAMLAGSLFGWDIPAADPDNYDENGLPLIPAKEIDSSDEDTDMRMAM